MSPPSPLPVPGHVTGHVTGNVTGHVTQLYKIETPSQTEVNKLYTFEQVQRERERERERGERVERE